MLTVAKSSFTVGSPEADGRRYVKETHKVSNGQEFEYTWLWDGILAPSEVMAARATKIKETLDRREATRAAVEGTSVPLTRYEFLSRFTSLERVAIRTASESDPYIQDFLEMLNVSGNVSLVRAREGLLYLEYKGHLTQERADIIGAES